MRVDSYFVFSKQSSKESVRRLLKENDYKLMYLYQSGILTEDLRRSYLDCRLQALQELDGDLG